MKRTFIAMDIPSSNEIKECLKTMSGRLNNEKIKWTDPDNLHLTLKFLGDTKEDLISDISEKLRRISSDLSVFTVLIAGAGVFRNLRDPRIIWLGIQENSILAHMKNLIENNLSPLGFPPEKRGFSPHLTIGRIKFLRDRKNLEELLEIFNNKTIIKFDVTEIIYYESLLKKEGPEYVPLGRFKFNKETRIK